MVVNPRMSISKKVGESGSLSLNYVEKSYRHSDRYCNFVQNYVMQPECPKSILSLY